MDPRLISVAIASAPAVIDFFKSLFAKANPNDPPLTDAEAIAGLSALVTSSLAVDAGWLMTHKDA